MTQFRLCQITTFYDRRGAIKSQATDVVQTFATMDPAFVAFNGRRRGAITFPSPNESIRYQVQDANGARLSLTDYYRHVIGEEEFHAQLADEDFAINLDLWLASYVGTGDLAQAIRDARASSARDARAALNAIFG